MRVVRVAAAATRPVRRITAVTGVAALALAAGLGGMPGAGAQSAQPGGATAVSGSPATAPPAAGVSSSARFATVPRGLPATSSLRAACGTPSHPGQMACNALVPKAPHPRAASGPPSGALAPASLQAAYGLTAASASQGHGQTVAIVDAFNDPSAASDLATYRDQYKLPACTLASGCLKIVNQAGGTSLPKVDSTGGWELEESLDLDMVSAICPNCHILLVESSSDSIASLAIAENYATSHATIVSDSWGSAAEFIGEGAYDPAFNKPGVAIVAAAGDDSYGSQYPASAQWVTSVGGTSLRSATNDRGWTETAWSGTGSGCSSIEASAAWAQSVAPTVKDGGAVPNWIAPGGTSVATPIIASLYALAATAAGPARYPVPHTYPAAYPYAHRGAFFDVTSGANGSCEPSRAYLCTARAGYDGPTGLGSPDGIGGFAPVAANTVSLVDPGTLAAERNASVSLQLKAHDAASGTLTWSAAGLPAGLTLSATGLLSGKPTATGTRTVNVTATNQATSGSGSVSFRVAVAGRLADPHPAAGPVRLAAGGMCLHDNGNSAAIGTHAVASKCSGVAAQRWAYLPAGNPGGAGQLRIHGRCLAVSGSGAVLAACASVRSQWWALRAGGQIASPHANKCLADPGASARNGTRLTVVGCSGAASQSWTLPAAPVISAVAGQCLADPGNARAAGTRMVIAACSTAAGQKWVRGANGSLRINGKCLTAAGNLLDGAPVQLAACTGGTAKQVWQRAAGGQLMNSRSGKCLAVPAGASQGGTQVVQDDCTGRLGGIWAIS
jgi:hypothetical protein